MKTKIHFYSISTRTPEGQKEWAEFKQRMKSIVPLARRLKVIGTQNMPFAEGQEIELETRHLFSNQWNTAGEKGVRVFDWFQAVSFQRAGKELPNKSGHWLEQTEEMREVRESTLVCGYCGHQEHKDTSGAFCASCLDSPHLEEKELGLLRMLPVAEHLPRRPSLTDQERADLLPRYIKAQTVAKGSRAKARRERQRARIEQEHNEALQNAEAEYQGMVWLWDRYVPLDNVIFYTHTGRFAIGWKSGVDDAVAEEITKKLEGFPYPIDIKRK